MRSVTDKIVEVIILTSCLAATAHAATFACPQTSDTNPMVDAVVSRTITSSRIDAKAVQTLRSEVPALHKGGTSNGAIVDHAISCYCAILAKDNNQSDQQKQSALAKFAAHMTASIYSPDQESAFLSVALPSDLFDRIDVAAAKAGETTDVWVRRAIESKLSH